MVMRKARWLKGVMIVWAVIFGIYGMQREAQGQGLGNIASVDNVRFDANAYDTDKKYDGQCVTYVKNARPELNFTFGDGYKGKSITNQRIKNAEDAGFVVNDIPRIGAAFLVNVPIPTKKDGFIAHTGIVTNVKLVEKDGKDFYVVNVRESNYTNPLKMDTRDEIYLPFPDTGWQFIQEKKTDYDAKQQQAIEQVVQTFKNTLGREPNADEITEYSRKRLVGITVRQELLESPKYADERQEHIRELRAEIKKAQEKSQTARIKEETKEKFNELKESMKKAGKKILKEVKDEILSPATAIDAGLHMIGIKMPVAGLAWPKKVLAPSDASQLSQRTAGDIPVTVNFQQSISGYYTQRPDYFGARGANWAATLSGTRTGAGSVPGSFTGSGSGRAEAFPGYFANTLNNKPLSLTTQGQVTASGKAGQPLTGTMTSTFNTTGIESVSLKGPVTLNPNGSLKWQNFSGEVRHNGTQVGTMSGTVNQGPTK